MNPMLLSLLLSGGTAGIGALMGAGKDPRADYLRQLMRILDPKSVGMDTAALYQHFLQNVMPHLTGLGVGQSNTLRNSLATRMSGGTGTTGVGSIFKSMADSSLGSILGNYRAQGYQGAQSGALNLASLKAGGLQGGPAPYNMGNQLFGAGMGGIGDVMRLYLQSKNPYLPQNFIGPRQ